MNRKQRVKMIVRVLLSPFTRDPFERQDLLLENAKAYRRLRDHDGLYRNLVQKNEKTQKALVNSLINEIQPDRLGELGELIEKFYPSSELTDHLEHISEDSLEGYYFNVLLNLSTEFITLRDGKTSIKMWETTGSEDEFFPDSSGLYKVELWSEISRVITPDVLIAGYYVRCGIKDIEYLRRLPDNIFLSDNIFSQISRKGLAETHLHLSAGMSYLSVWEAVTDPSAQRRTSRKGTSIYQKKQRHEQETHSELIIAGWLRLMMAKYLEACQNKLVAEDILPFYLHDDMKRHNKTLEQEVLEYVLEGRGNESNTISNLLQKSASCSSILMDRYAVMPNTSDIDVLARGLYSRYRTLQTAPEILLLFFALDHIRHFPSHSEFQHVFLCYLRIKNAYFSHKLQSTGMSGLTFFREYFAEATSSLVIRTDEDSKKRQLAYQAAFRNQFHCADLVKLEVKVAPPAPTSRQANNGAGEYRLALTEQITEIMTAYLSVLQEANNLRMQKQQVPTLGIIYHLIRGNMHRLPGDMCWAVETSAGPGDVISTIRRQSTAFVEGLQYLLRKVPYLSEYIVGLDVASEELYAEPWVYAPVYRRARNRYCTYPIQLDTGDYMQNIGFTYHVGEDYHHVISGLRHIDEVLTYFGYKAGDRLGHGMALQVDLPEWAHNNEVTLLPTMEYLENLLWIWSLCSEDSANLLQYLPGLEKEIMELATKLYSNVKGLSPRVLWSAYRLKFQTLSDDFCRQMEMMYLRPSEDASFSPMSYQLPMQRSFCVRNWRDTQDGNCHLPWDTNVWDAEKLLLTHYCPAYERCYRKPYFAFTDQKKLALYQAVQLYMREKVQKMGIYIETNPTSNLLIGDIRSLQEYPIDTLNNRFLQEPSSATVLISVNSDDPLIFNTNIENELALVYHMLLYRNIDRERVINWIDKVRKYGLNSSFIRKTKDLKTQVSQIKEIISHLARLRKELIGGDEQEWND